MFLARGCGTDRLAEGGEHARDVRLAVFVAAEAQDGEGLVQNHARVLAAAVH